jgi:hypothetical protein
MIILKLHLVVNWTKLAPNRDQRQSLVNTVMKLRVPWEAENLMTSWVTISFSWSTMFHGVSLCRSFCDRMLSDYISNNLSKTAINEHQTYQVAIEVLTAVSTKMAVFWFVAPCSLVEVYQRFRGPCCLHHQPDDGGSKYLWNVGKLLVDCTALQPRRQPSSNLSHIKNRYKRIWNISLYGGLLHPCVFYSSSLWSNAGTHRSLTRPAIFHSTLYSLILAVHKVTSHILWDNKN